MSLLGFFRRRRARRRLALAQCTFASDHPWLAAAILDNGRYDVLSGEPSGVARIEQGIAMFERLGYDDMSVIGGWLWLAISQHKHDVDLETLRSIERAQQLCAAKQQLRTMMCLRVLAEHGLVLAGTTGGRSDRAGGRGFRSSANPNSRAPRV